MSLQIEFGRMIRESRIARGYTQEELAELADITARYMHNIEYGKSEVGLRTATVLADILDIDLNILKPFAGTMLKAITVRNTTLKAQPTFNRFCSLQIQYVSLSCRQLKFS